LPSQGKSSTEFEYEFHRADEVRFVTRVWNLKGGCRRADPEI
jgi:hypothetical protein